MESKNDSIIDDKIDRYLSEKKNTVIQLGNLKLWEEKIFCTWHQKPIYLTKKEFNILRILIRRPNIVHTRAHIMDILSDDNLDVSERSVDSHIKRLRRKFMEANPGKIFKNIYISAVSDYPYSPFATIYYRGTLHNQGVII